MPDEGYAFRSTMTLNLTCKASGAQITLDAAAKKELAKGEEIDVGCPGCGDHHLFHLQFLRSRPLGPAFADRVVNPEGRRPGLAENCNLF
jgi:hypothetical protein